MEIDEETLNETIQCDYKFECLKNENHLCLLAKVEHCVGWKVHFINCTEKSCNYQLDYGASKICLCPTRKKIYNKYEK